MVGLRNLSKYHEGATKVLGTNFALNMHDTPFTYHVVFVFSDRLEKQHPSLVHYIIIFMYVIWWSFHGLLQHAVWKAQVGQVVHVALRLSVPSPTGTVCFDGRGREGTLTAE